jgi:hypothetical protein
MLVPLFGIEGPLDLAKWGQIPFKREMHLRSRIKPDRGVWEK